MTSKGKFNEQMKICARGLIEKALSVHNGNQCAAAEELGLHRNTMARYIRDFRIVAKDFYTKQGPVKNLYRKQNSFS